MVWVKSGTWAIIASSITFGVAFAMFGSVDAAGAIAIIDRVLKFVAFVAHEKIWAWGKTPVPCPAFVVGVGEVRKASLTVTEKDDPFFKNRLAGAYDHAEDCDWGWDCRGDCQEFGTLGSRAILLH